MINMTKIIRLGASLFKYAILFWLLYCIAYFCNGVDCLPPKHKAIIVAIVMFMSGCLLLTMTHRWMKHNLVKFLALLGLYILGIVVYYNAKCEDNMVNIISSANSTLSIFFPSRGSYSDGSRIDEDIFFQILHLLSYLFFAIIAFSFFGRRWISDIKRHIYLWMHKNIIWGYSEGGLLLAKDILSKTYLQHIIFVLQKSINTADAGEILFNKIDGIGAMTMYMDFDNLKRGPNGQRHFFITEDQDLNIRLALHVAKKVKRKTELFVRTENPFAWRLFKDYKNIELHVFNQSDLTARKFVMDYPMLDIVGEEQKKDLRINKTFRVLLLGFGWTGREVLNKIICDSQYVGSQFEATIFDSAFNDKYGDYTVLYNECIKKYHLHFNPNLNCHPFDKVGSSFFFNWLKDEIKNYDRIIVTLGNDSLNIEVAVSVSQVAQNYSSGDNRNFIFAHVKEQNHYQYCKDQNYPVNPFGDMAEIYTMDMVIHEKLDFKAKIINYAYWQRDGEINPEKIKNEAQSVWEDTKILFNKDSSRAAAANINNIIKLAGGESELLKCVADKQYLDILAETEHLRWNAFHYTKGIRKWEVSEIPAAHPTDAKLYRIENDEESSLIKHACLVDYKDLPAIANVINENRKLQNKTADKDFQGNDRRIIKYYPVFQQIHKLKK